LQAHHVVDQDGSLARHFANQDHACDLVGLLAFFVKQSKVQVEAGSEG
jgi:hypothetical protein